MSEKYDIGLGNNDATLRKKADSDYVSFWDEQAHNLSWFSPWERTLDWNPPFAKWFVGGKINASYNALDIHQATKSQKLPFYGKVKMVILKHTLMVIYSLKFKNLLMF